MAYQKRASNKQKSELIFHKALAELGPVEVCVKSDPRYIKSKDAFVVDLEINGELRGYWCENDECKAIFLGQKDQVFSIVAEGSRDEATILVVGEQIETPPPQRNAPAQRHEPDGAREHRQEPGGYKPMGATVGMSINNACASMVAEGLPFDKFEITRRASILLRMSRALEGGFLLKEDAQPKEAGAATPKSVTHPPEPAGPSDDVPF